MQQFIDLLDGNKTKILSFVLFILGILRATHVIDDETFKSGAAVLAGPGVYAARDAFRKIEPK